MEFDKKESTFLLTPEDITLLGEPAYAAAEPLNMASDMYTRAESRAAMNEARYEASSPYGANTCQLRADIVSTGIKLSGIMGILRPHVPEKVSLASTVEAHLDEWARKFGNE